MGEKIETPGISVRIVGARKPPKRAPFIAPAQLPRGELEAMWSAAHAVDDVDHAGLIDSAPAFYFARRGWCARSIATLDLLRVTPMPSAYSWPRWWPRAWAHTWRLVARAFDARGNFASIAGVSLVAGATPAIRWPQRHPRRHLLADARGAAFLAGDVTAATRVIVCESFDDFATLSIAVADAGRSDAVLGAMPEAVPTLRAVRWAPDVPVVIQGRDRTTDDAYCAAVRHELPPSVDLRRSKPANSQEGAR